MSSFFDFDFDFDGGMEDDCRSDMEYVRIWRTSWMTSELVLVYKLIMNPSQVQLGDFQLQN